MYFTSTRLGVVIPDGSDLPIAEETVDGGRTWYPVNGADGSNVQMTLCITP